MPEPPAAESPPPRLELREVTRAFDDGDRGRVTAVRALSFALAPGEITLLVGPSGAGKSTVLALAAGLLLPTEGEVLLDGSALSRLREPFRAELRRTRMGVALQSLALVPRMSALENALLPWLVEEPSEEPARRVLSWLERLGLAELTRARVETLSGGERQRVALARAFAAEPALLLLDEPTAHLDAAHAEAVCAAVEARAQQGGAALVATHDPRVLERFSRRARVTLAARA